MKKTTLLLCIFLCGYAVQAQSWISSNRISGSGDITVIQSISDLNNNTLVLGYFLDTIYYDANSILISRGGRDYFTAKFDSEGNTVWVKGIGGSSKEYVSGGIINDELGNVYITGGFTTKVMFTDTDSAMGFGKHDIFLTKFDPDGNFIWGKNIGAGALNQRPQSLTLNSSNGIVLSGTFSDSITIDTDTTLYSDDAVADYFYCEFDDLGTLRWIKQIKATNNTLSGRITGISSHGGHYTMVGLYSDTAYIEDDTLASISAFDVHIFETDLLGNVDWIRRIKGDGFVYAYNIEHDENDNNYIAGYFNSPTLVVDATENTTMTITSQHGDYDFFVAKYSPTGTLEWIRTNGGESTDKLFDLQYFQDEIHVTGFFSDTMSWGGIELTTEGTVDKDMFIGTLDLEGNYRSSNSYGGRNNSWEEARSISLSEDNLYSVIRSNSDLLSLGEDDYTSTNGKYYVVLGIISCLPISIDNTIYNNVATCYGDSTGSIQISATGGFGSPWEYSIDNGMSYSDQVIYTELPAGDYQVVVIDKENCAQTGPLVTLTQPDSLEVELVSSEDITADQDGSIVVVANGGTAPYTYYLVPDGALQAIGTFSFVSGDSGKYVVAVNDLNGCGPVMTDSIKISEIIIPDGIENAFGLNVKVYPNPTSGIITLEMPFEGTECEMEVLSMTGQVVLKRRVFSNGGVLNESIDLSDQAKGLYMLRVDGVSLRSAIMVK